MADLTTVAAVKAHLAITSSTQDALLAGYIARESGNIESYTQRTFPAVTRTARALDGTGSDVLFLPDRPVLSVALLEIDGTEVEFNADIRETGYQYSDSALFLNAGAKFPKGRRNVVCTWTAGYSASQTAFVPASVAYTITPTEGGRAVTDQGVTRVSTGAALTLVGSSPTTGQYSFSAGVYTFAAADAGVQMTMSYYYVPGPVEQACIDLVSQDLKGRDNVGVKSKSLAGETITYSSDGLTTGVKQTLNPFRNLVPA